MEQSILVFVSHSSEDKSDLVEPIVADLETCYINVWLDKKKIMPGENLRKSIFRDGLDKADIALIFFTEKSLKSSWVDREIKHVLREETKKGNDFNLNKIISIFDSAETYKQIADRYPELTDDLLHLMPKDYNKIQLGQLVSAIWSKYFLLQGGDIQTQKQLLAKDKELFQKDKELQELKIQLEEIKFKTANDNPYAEFEQFKSSGKIRDFIANGRHFLRANSIDRNTVVELAELKAFGLVESVPSNMSYVKLTAKGAEFFKWLYLSNQM